MLVQVLVLRRDYAVDRCDRSNHSNNERYQRDPWCGVESAVQPETEGKREQRGYDNQTSELEDDGKGTYRSAQPSSNHTSKNLRNYTLLISKKQLSL